MENKTLGQKLTEELTYAPKSAFDLFDDAAMEAADRFALDYRAYLDASKTEREAVKVSVAELEAAGYQPFVPGSVLKTGDKFYFVNRNKCLISVHIGKKSLAEGIRIVMAHIDSPRLDLKPRPLVEDTDFAYLKTNYYGGIRKYQWPAMPMALHGVIYKKNGEAVNVVLGEAPTEPCFTVTDLLPHLARKQAGRPVEEIVVGENLKLLVGSRPFKDDKASEKVKLNILKWFFDKYGVTEEDFISAELEAVPAYASREVGLDGSMIGGYGQDDRVCAYPCHRAMMDVTDPEYTTCCLLCDKEETGSDGNTGLASNFFLNFLEELAESAGVPVRRMLAKSMCLSADVTPAYDPAWPEVHDRQNASFLNKGVAIMKYSGSGGKYSTSDASAETMAYFRASLNQAGVPWQIGCLGAVDAGGGGTLAKYIANLNVDVLDIGVPVLSMHSPFEVTAKTDVYAAYLAFAAFLKADPKN